jgi:hypothetical protein
MTGQPRQEVFERAAMTEKPWQDINERTTMEGQPWQDSQDFIWSFGPAAMIDYFCKQCWGSGMLIRDVYPGSHIRHFPPKIPDPNFFHPRSASKKLSILSRILIFYPSWIPDPRSRGSKSTPGPRSQDTRSGSAKLSIKIGRYLVKGCEKKTKTVEFTSIPH